MANDLSSITGTPTVNENHATIKVDGSSFASGSPSGAINQNVGTNTVSIIVDAQTGITTDTYIVTVTRVK